MCMQKCFGLNVLHITISSPFFDLCYRWWFEKLPVQDKTTWQLQRAAGALMKEALSRYKESTPKDMYADIPAPVMVAKPEVITACNSDMVILGSIGFTSNGAVVWEKLK